MSVNFNTPLLDVKSLFPSIVNLTNRRVFLDAEMLKEFWDSLYLSLTDMAYKDHLEPISPELAQRMQEVDIPHLSSVLDSLEIPPKKFTFALLLANMQKVSGSFFEVSSPIYQIWSSKNESGTPLFWGWIQKEYVDSSPLKAKNGIVRFKDLSPNVIWALHRFQDARLFRDKKIFIPVNYLVELLNFSVQNKIELLTKELRCVIHSNFSSDFRDEHFKKFKVPSHFYPAGITCKEEPRGTHRPSPYFDANNPYRSIKVFVERCCTLRREDQLDFLASIRNFFLRSAFLNQTVEISADYIDRFAAVDLPFLLETSPSSGGDDKTRLLMAIQEVSRKQFDSMNTITTVELAYGNRTELEKQIAWINATLTTPSRQGYRNLEPLPLTESTEVVPVLRHSTHDILKEQDHDKLALLLDMGLATSAETFVNLVIIEIKRRSKDATEEVKTALSDALAHYCQNPMIAQLLERHQITLSPRKQVLSSKQSRDIFMQNLKVMKQSSFREVVETSLQDNPQRTQVLREFWELATGQEKQRLLQYCIEEAYPNVRSDFAEPMQQLFQMNVASDIPSIHRKYPIDWLKVFTILVNPEFRENFILGDLLSPVIESFYNKKPEIVARHRLETLKKRCQRSFSEDATTLLTQVFIRPLSRQPDFVPPTHFTVHELCELVNFLTSTELQQWQQETFDNTNYLQTLSDIYQFDVAARSHQWTAIRETCREFEAVLTAEFAADPWLCDILNLVKRKLMALTKSVYPLEEAPEDDHLFWEDIFGNDWDWRQGVSKIVTLLRDPKAIAFFNLTPYLQKMHATLMRDMVALEKILDIVENSKEFKALFQLYCVTPYNDVRTKIFNILWQASRGSLPEYQHLRVRGIQGNDIEDIELFVFFQQRLNLDDLQISLEKIDQTHPKFLDETRERRQIKQLMIKLGVRPIILKLISKAFGELEWGNEILYNLFIEDINRNYSEYKKELIAFLKNEELRNLTYNSKVKFNQFRKQFLNSLEPQGFLAALTPW